MTSEAGTSSAAKRRRADVRRPPDWWSSYPSLHLMIYPDRDGLKLTLVFMHRDSKGQRHAETLASAKWAPPEVTQERCVDWAQRALAAYLMDRSFPEAMQQATAE